MDFPEMSGPGEVEQRLLPRSMHFAKAVIDSFNDGTLYDTVESMPPLGALKSDVNNTWMVVSAQAQFLDMAGDEESIGPHKKEYATEFRDRAQKLSTAQQAVQEKLATLVPDEGERQWMQLALNEVTAFRQRLVAEADRLDPPQAEVAGPQTDGLPPVTGPALQ